MTPLEHYLFDADIPQFLQRHWLEKAHLSLFLLIAFPGVPAYPQVILTTED